MKQREGIVVPSFSKKGSLLCASWQYCSVCVTSCLVKYQTVLPLTTISVMITLFFPFVRPLVTMDFILLKVNRSYFLHSTYCSVELHSKMSNWVLQINIPRQKLHFLANNSFMERKRLTIKNGNFTMIIKLQ